MKRIFTSLITIFSFVGFVSGQQQLENPGFENWEDAGTVVDEPVDWSSIKTSDASSLNGLAPQVWEQSTDAHSGSYSVKLTNLSAGFGVIATGTLTNGRVHADFNPSNGYVFTETSDAKWNTPFTDRPDSIVGWYKYTPASGDKGKVEVILHTGAAQNPENGTAANFIARARFITPTTIVSSWTRFSTPFQYMSSGSPTYALVVLTSGDSTIAKANSVAYYDDLELIYNASSVEEMTAEDVLAYQNGGQLNINLRSNNASSIALNVYDLQGRLMLNQNGLVNGLNTVDLPNNMEGLYFVTVELDGKALTKKVFITTF